MPPATNHPLRDLWLAYNETHGFDRWVEYSHGYERHLPAPCTDAAPASLRMLEIGIQSGGAARMWRQRYGAQLYYTGVDIEPAARRTQSSTENIFVEIGSQANASFLARVCRKHGPFHIVIDDGSHRPVHMWEALKAIFPSDACMAPRSVYVVEDTHSMVMRSRFLDGCESAADVYNIAGEAFWSMHHKWAYKDNAGFPGGAKLHPVFRDRVRGVYAYDSILFIASGPSKPKLAQLVRPLKQYQHNETWMPYGKGHPTRQIKDSSHCKRKCTCTDGANDGSSSAHAVAQPEVPL